MACAAWGAPCACLSSEGRHLPRVTWATHSRTCSRTDARDQVVGSAGRWLWEAACGPTVSVSCRVTCALPDSGSPLTDGSSCLPVMTRPSSCGTRPAASVSTRTVSMAGECPDHRPSVKKKKSVDPDTTGPHGLRGRRRQLPHLSCSLSSVSASSPVTGRSGLVPVPTGEGRA